VAWLSRTDAVKATTATSAMLSVKLWNETEKLAGVDAITVTEKNMVFKRTGLANDAMISC
jgi:hypothetical protein